MAFSGGVSLRLSSHSYDVLNVIITPIVSGITARTGGVAFGIFKSILEQVARTKKWVIITKRFAKDVENNSIARLNSYARQYVSRSVRGGQPATRAGNGGAEDHIEEVVVLDVLDLACVYTFICVEIKINTETVALRMLQKVQTTPAP
jgi:hypothetical protein